MSQEDQGKAVIVGGGLVGGLAAIYMAKKHGALFPGGVEVYERREDSRQQKILQGRSINLAISSRSFSAFEKVDPNLVAQVKNRGIKMFGRLIHSKNGDTEFQPYGKENEYILSTDRRWLNEFLISEAEKYSNIKTKFEYKAEKVSFRAKSINFLDKQNNRHIVNARLIVACDGMNSQIRTDLQKNPHARLSVDQHYTTHSYKELSIPMNPVTKGFAVREDCLHIWPRGEYMIIALPNPSKDFTVTYFAPQGNAHNPTRGSFAWLDQGGDERVLQFFREEFGDVFDAMKPELLKDWHLNPTSALPFVKCDPHHYSDSVVLLGDAAHAIVPFYGQGTNCGFEDCKVLSSIIEKHTTGGTCNFANALEEYSIVRKPAADAICELSLYNFTEMCAKTASRTFLIQKKIGLFLHKFFPSYKPLYTMVTFTPEMTYADAWNTQKQRDERISSMISFVKNLVGYGTLGALTYIAGKKAYENKPDDWKFETNSFMFWKK